MFKKKKLRGFYLITYLQYMKGGHNDYILNLFAILDTQKNL